MVYLREAGIRTLWVEQDEKWYVVAADVMRQFGGSRNPGAYWRQLKRRLKAEGKQVEAGSRLMPVGNGRGRCVRMAVMDLVLFFRVVQELRSPRASRVKMWLASAGGEQAREMYDPERSLERALDNWREMGRDEKWILQRVMSQETRHRLTAYWGAHGIRSSEEFRALTNLIHQAWSSMTVQEHKVLKGLRSQNLRDHMTEPELIFMALAELTTRIVAENRQAKGLEDNMLAAVKAGEITGNARKELEEATGQRVVSSGNFLAANGPAGKKK